MIKLLCYRLAVMLQVMLFCQPDAKVANGMYWFNFWLNLASKLVQ